MSDIVLSGIRATGKLHFGNFLGAVRNFLTFQGNGNLCLYFVADWHTLTSPVEPDEMKRDIIEIVKDYIAAGLDPEQSILYTQSSVPEIAELCLYLSMMQSIGSLRKIPTFKEKVKKQPDNVNLGLFTYPVLMAADILGPRATLVPVGEDQIPNVELARDLARRFNNEFGETFPIPEMMTRMIRVPGLDGEKMGKSDADNAIGIRSSKDEVLQRYMQKGITDTQRVSVSDLGDPYNRCKSVYPVHEIVTENEAETREIANLCMNANIGCRDCKVKLVDSIMNILGPFQEKRTDLDGKDDEIREILHEGGKRARDRIRPTVEQVRDKMGIVIH